jgi:glutamyl-tRNA synthetase
VEALIRVLQNAGITYDEGPMLSQDGQMFEVGDKGPYIQSRRLELYKTYAEELVKADKAYDCFCTEEELARARKVQQLLKRPTNYHRQCLTLSKDEVRNKLASNAPHVIRMKVPEGETVLQDLIRGRIVFQNLEVDDQVLLKSDGFPTYHLANVVDDHLMEISHVIRGEEWITSTPKHLILYGMLSWTPPIFAHLPLLLNADKSKLSKRQGDVAVEEYLKKGYLPEALLNFVALLGYNPKGDQEIYSKEDLERLFDLEKVNPSGAVVNFEKLDWMNATYLRQKSVEELFQLAQPILSASPAGESIQPEMLKKILEVEKPRLTTLLDIAERVKIFTEAPAYDPNLLVWKKADKKDAKENLERLEGLFTKMEETAFRSWTALEQEVCQWIEETHFQNGNVLWPLRVALTGQKNSAGPFELLWVLGKEEGLKRIRRAIELISV